MTAQGLIGGELQTCGISHAVHTNRLDMVTVLNFLVNDGINPAAMPDIVRKQLFDQLYLLAVVNILERLACRHWRLPCLPKLHGTKAKVCLALGKVEAQLIDTFDVDGVFLRCVMTPNHLVKENLAVASHRKHDVAIVAG